MDEFEAEKEAALCRLCDQKGLHYGRIRMLALGLVRMANRDIKATPSKETIRRREAQAENAQEKPKRRRGRPRKCE